MIEQCRFVLNSQIFVRRAGPSAGGASPRITSAGGNEEISIDLGGNPVTAADLVTTGNPAVLTIRRPPAYARAAYRPACVTNFVTR
jgi:hypothetical protein